MGFAERLFDGLRSTIELRGDVDDLMGRMTQASAQLLDHEKRLIRIETMIEFSQMRGASRQQLPEQS